MRRLFILMLLALAPTLAHAQSTNADGSRTYNGVTKGGRSGTATAPRTNQTAPTRTTPPPRFDPYEADAFFIADLGLGMLGGNAIGGAATGQGMARLRFGRDALWGLGVSTALSGNGNGFLSETDLGPIYHLDLAFLHVGLQPSLILTAGSGRAMGMGLGVRAYGTIDIGRFGIHLDPLIGQANSGFMYNLKVGASYRVTPTIHGRVSYDNRGVIGGAGGALAQLGAHGVVATVGVRF